jgi:hypothetical protein
LEEWLQHPSFLKSVQGEESWIKTFLAENRNGISVIQKVARRKFHRQ